MVLLHLLLGLPLGCSAVGLTEDPPTQKDSADTAAGDSAETADTEESADSAETADTGDSGDTADSADSAETGDSGETGDTAPPPTAIWALDEYATRWVSYPVVTTAHAPTAAIETAFAIPDVGRVWVLTRYTWHVLVTDTMEWIDSGDRDGLFPELRGLQTQVAVAIPAYWMSYDGVADVLILVGTTAYQYTYTIDTSAFASLGPTEVGPEWFEVGAPDTARIRAGWLAVDEEAGWLDIGSPAAACGAEAVTLGPYIAFLVDSGQMYAYDAGSCFEFVGSQPAATLDLFGYPGAPDPDDAAAIDWTGQALLVFAE